MKRGTTPILKVEIDIDITKVQSIIFLFKKVKSENAPAILSKSYPTDVSYRNGYFNIAFTEQETRLFEGYFYMDTRIVTKANGIAETELSTLYMSETLFSEADVWYMLVL